MNRHGMLERGPQNVCQALSVAAERERERAWPAWLMRTGLCSCLSLLQQGNETMADRRLVLVPGEQTHAPRSILEQAGNWALM